MKKKIIPVIAAGLLILVVMLFMLLGNLIEKYSPSKETEDLSTYYGLSSDTEVALILNNEVLDAKGRLIDGHVYLDYNTVYNYINSRFYWDSNENILRYTTSTDLISGRRKAPAIPFPKKQNLLTRLSSRVMPLWPISPLIL